jgi:hypothetical protein
MSFYNLWKDLIRPTLFAYILAFLIPLIVAALYYLYDVYY